MSKAILVIDIPDDYEEYGDWYIVGDYLKIVYEEDGSLIDYKYIDDDMAQLKPMPEKMRTDVDDIEESSYYQGWNDCVDEILGEEDDR